MKSEDVIVVGKLRTIAFARDESGRAQAREFLEGECPPKDRKRFRHWFQLVADLGEQSTNAEGFKHEVGPIHAFKASEARIAAFRIGTAWLLAHGFIKKRNTWPPMQFERAERIRSEFMARESQG